MTGRHLITKLAVPEDLNDRQTLDNAKILAKIYDLDVKIVYRRPTWDGWSKTEEEFRKLKIRQYYIHFGKPKYYDSNKRRSVYKKTISYTTPDALLKAIVRIGTQQPK